jgi:hypothetical protein
VVLRIVVVDVVEPAQAAHPSMQKL